MCKHTHEWVKTKGYSQLTQQIEECRWTDYIQAISPNDPEFILPHDSEGMCIFHSKDLEWKRNNDFAESFIALFMYLEEDENISEIRFHNFHFVGIDMEEKEDNEIIKYYHLHLASFVIKKYVILLDCIFHDSIEMLKMTFLDDFALINCEFKQKVEMMNCKFRKDFDIDKGTHFRNDFYIQNFGQFDGQFTLQDSKFDRICSLTNLHCKEVARIEGIKFKDETFAISGVFHNGLIYRENISSELVEFEECVFYSDSMIAGISRESNFLFNKCQIKGNLLLQGSQDSLLFGPNSSIEIEEKNFGTHGKMTFDWCDLLELNQNFLYQLKDLEQKQKLIINPTCRIDRLRVTYEYPNSSEIEDLIEDLNRLIVRYFRTLFANNLTIDVSRKEKPEPVILISLSTRENIARDVFFHRLQESVHYILSNSKNINTGKSIPEDLKIVRDAIHFRFLQQLNNGTLNDDDLLNIMSCKNNITINNIYLKEFIMGNKIDSSQKSTNILGVSIQSMRNFFSGNSNSETDVLFQRAFKDIASSTKFSDTERQNVLELLQEIKRKVDKSEPIPALMKDSLLSATGSLASIISLLQGIA